MNFFGAYVKHIEQSQKIILTFSMAVNLKESGHTKKIIL